MFKSPLVLNMLRVITCLLVAGLVLNGCQSQPKTKQTAQAEQTLYQELGGKPAIKETVYRLVFLLHHDDRLKALFVDVNRKELTQNIEDFLCQVSDGGCDYMGASMLDSHAGLNISKAEFDHFVSIFIKAMTRSRIDFTAQNKLLARLAALRPEIIEL